MYLCIMAPSHPKREEKDEDEGLFFTESYLVLKEALSLSPLFSDEERIDL